MRRLTISLPDELYNWLTERAEIENRSISGQVAATLKLFKDSIGPHSAGLHPPSYSLQDEQWQALKRINKKEEAGK